MGQKVNRSMFMSSALVVVTAQTRTQFLLGNVAPCTGLTVAAVQELCLAHMPARQCNSPSRAHTQFQSSHECPLQLSSTQ
jgi:hypothetical protein